jgi:hypothetical protein
MAPLADELGLSTEQSDRMRAIWQSVREQVDDCFVRAQAVQKQRDRAIFDILTDEQKAKFAAAQKEYDNDVAALKSRRESAFNEAVQRTKAILTDAQKQRYDEILQSRLHRDSSPDFLGNTPASKPD